MDSGVLTTAILTYVEIIESTRTEKIDQIDDDYDEEVDPVAVIPQQKETLHSIQTLRLFLQCQDESQSVHHELLALDKIEKSVHRMLMASKKQKKITDYFSINL